jgi:hypothetical protein
MCLQLRRLASVTASVISIRSCTHQTLMTWTGPCWEVLCSAVGLA